MLFLFQNGCEAEGGKLIFSDLTNQNGNLHNPTLRVLAILHLIDISPEGVSLAAISEQLQLPKGTISPILKTLASTGYISCENMLYRIGFRSFELGLSYGKDSNLLDIIRNQMKDLVAEVEEITQFGILRERNVLYLLRVNSDNPISIVTTGVGKQLPAQLTGLGKAMLAAAYTDEEIAELYRDYVFPTPMPNSIGSAEALIENLREVRATGFARDNEEVTKGVCCTAVALNVGGTVQGAFSVTSPVYRMNDRKRSQIERCLQQKKLLIEEICRVQGLSLYA